MESSIFFSTDGSTFDLAVLRGKTVLLFFQEGIACEPCWTQIKDIESNMQQFRALGILIDGEPFSYGRLSERKLKHLALRPPQHKE